MHLWDPRFTLCQLEMLEGWEKKRILLPPPANARHPRSIFLVPSLGTSSKTLEGAQHITPGQSTTTGAPCWALPAERACAGPGALYGAVHPAFFRTEPSLQHCFGCTSLCKALPSLPPPLPQLPSTCWWKFMGLCSEQGRPSEAAHADGAEDQRQQFLGRAKSVELLASPATSPAQAMAPGQAAVVPRTGSASALQS